MSRAWSIALLGVLVAAPLAAQSRRGLAEVETQSQRHGFWMQFGAGGGMEQLNLENDGLGYSDELWAPTFNFRVGGTVGENARLGADFNAWVRADGDFTEVVSSVMPVLQLYPAKQAGIHIRGGGGFAWSSVYDDIFNTRSTINGFGTVAGVGWELPLSRKVFLTPYADWYQYWFDSREVGDFTERVIVVGVGITFQSH